MTSVTAVVVAYGASTWLADCVTAALASRDVHVDVVVVDNGDTGGAVDGVAGLDGVTVVRPGRNLGFAAGCNAGAAVATGEVLALVNPDVLVGPDALARLAAVATEPGVGIATASLRLADDCARLNSAGNPVHYVGLAWAGAHGQPAAHHRQRAEVASASGACCALRRDLWAELDGFEPAYFAYHEDVELSLRCWQRGLTVDYVPDAEARHVYEFGRNAAKTYLLERNRWLTVLTLYSARTLLLLSPALAVVEVLMLGMAAAQGWLPAKLRGYRWLLGNAGFIRRRHARLAAERQSTDRERARLFAARVEPTNVAALPGLAVLNAFLAGYWRVARRLL